MSRVVRILKRNPYLGAPGEELPYDKAISRYAKRLAIYQGLSVLTLGGLVMAVGIVIKIFTSLHLLETAIEREIIGWTAILVLVAIVIYLPLALGKWGNAWDYYKGRYVIEEHLHDAEARGEIMLIEQEGL